MIDYISGKIVELTPTCAVLDNGGIGYSIEISLQTYAVLDGKEEGKLYIHHHLQSSSDTEDFYGFASKDERALFETLLAVSGVGVNSARMILSTLTADELRQAILSENVTLIKSVKGIGLKTAQRLILELKDKIVKGAASADVQISAPNNAVVEEASAALVMLGFSKPNIQKALQAVIKQNPNAKVEDLIKSALQIL